MRVLNQHEENELNNTHYKLVTSKCEFRIEDNNTHIASYKQKRRFKLRVIEIVVNYLLTITYCFKCHLWATVEICFKIKSKLTKRITRKED